MLHISTLSGKLNGQQVVLRGWIYTKRLHGRLVFLTLRDSTGLVQVTIHKGQLPEEEFETAQEVTVESSVTVGGQVKADPRAPGGVEVQCTTFQVLAKAFDDYPIQVGAGKEFLLDKRHLHIRSPTVTAILKVKASFIQAAREGLGKNGFIEVHCPLLINVACEGGATLFPVNYFKRKAYLSQSVQLYQEAAITALEKVYSVEPSFRAEKSRTRRHLTEFWQIEAEAANTPLTEILKIQENLLTTACRLVRERSKAEFKFLRRRFKPPKPPFQRITYSKAVEILRGLDVEFEWGEDFGAVEERVLSKQFKQPFFVTHFPRRCKAFYHDPDPTDPEVTLSADLLAPRGFGEIAGGGQRISDFALLVESLKEFKLNPEDYEWYLDLRRYGSVVHSGFGMGVERVIRWMLRLPHIRDATLFPRTPARVYP
ncbi:MAG: asparagine--tRNA ligase [Candidatus Bathyarchaeota archaeon]|nr:asparagine--tRNA ligase [Candidatus Bathyarchaeota archaeon]